MAVGPFWYNKAWEQLLKAGLGDLSAGGTVVKAMLVKTSYTFDKAHAFVSDVVAHEVSGTGYVAGFGGAGRKTLAGKTVTRQTSTPWDVLWDADSLTWTSINTGADQLGGLILWFPKTSDADSPLIHFDDTQYPVTTSGINFVHDFNAAGINKIKY